MILVHFQGKPFNIAVIQVNASTTSAEEPRRQKKKKKTKKMVLFIIGEGNRKVGSQEIPGVMGKFGLEYKMKQGKD